MTLMELIQTRRTIHHFKPEQVDPQIIQEALSLMQFIPNHHLSQTWHFHLIGEQTKAQLLALAKIEFSLKNADNAMAKVTKWANIPHWIMVTQNIHDKSTLQIQEDYASISAGLYAMMLFLHSKEIGSKWSTGRIIQTPRWLKICQINPKIHNVVGLFWIGYPDKIPNMPPRHLPSHYITHLN